MPCKQEKRGVSALTLLFLQRAGKIPLLSKVQLPAALHVPSTDQGVLYSGTLRVMREWLAGEEVVTPASVSVGAAETMERREVAATAREAAVYFMFVV